MLSFLFHTGHFLITFPLEKKDENKKKTAVHQMLHRKYLFANLNGGDTATRVCECSRGSI